MRERVLQVLYSLLLIDLVYPLRDYVFGTSTFNDPHMDYSISIIL